MNEERITISKKDLKRLVFWSHVGLGYAKGGSYQKYMPSLIVSLMLRLKMKPRNFCCFFNPLENNVLSIDVRDEYTKRFGYLIDTTRLSKGDKSQ